MKKYYLVEITVNPIRETIVYDMSSHEYEEKPQNSTFPNGPETIYTHWFDTSEMAKAFYIHDKKTLDPKFHFNN
ncbi:hypothetical protein NZ47_02675 [Anaerovibrio lipolyticus]|uniref:Uncharacterized protein n=1 Tax=Anaerovibrio lipolyticus TaxID=82374 RepID=A0A0B2K1Y8_9FIRM|nr:hypothetical protein [Anaerovibrio lipolyticus]KHM52761.1 hypothetical protein NZ47_02675 [Anaerovibrio lipolyticus]